jgi:hypothetical protein
LHNRNSAVREKLADTNRGDSNGPRRKKISVIVEWREERDTEAAIGHGIEQSVTGGCKKKIQPKSEATYVRANMAKSDKHHSGCEHRREGQRMCEGAMPPRVTVVDAET